MVCKYLFAHGFRYRKNDKRYQGKPDIVLPKKLYEENGFSEENGNLIITMDSLDGAIDSEEIQRKIDEYFM